MALRARARAADKCSRGLRSPRDMEGVLDIHRLDVDVVASAAKAAAGKVSKHRDLVLAGCPEDRFVPFAVEEGGRLGTDAEAFVDAIVRAGSADPTTWCATNCMRAIAFTTARGVARVLTRPRRSSAAPKPPSATSLAHLAHITTPLDHLADAATLAPTTAEDPFYSSTTTSPMQSAAAMVGA